ncbi:MAG: HAD family hydrolase [Deltaproteobacteria bacterium]|nr:HAD family hydrolase [Deltaproteobacteria bacterium]MBW2360891.1 HAD family hydrolase [Deltaproteobacteria bacterium]
MRLLALDFDGVISDSAPEAFVVAMRTWCALHPASRLCQPAEPLLDEARVPSSADVAGCSLYAPFLEMMPLGNRAEDYAVELHALEAGAVIPGQTAYDAFKADIDAGSLRAFHKRFYRVRAALSERDAAAWQRLMGAYPGVPELLRRRSGECVLAIATSKDRRSVRKLLAAYGIDDLFPETSVLDKEAGVSKRAHLERLGSAHGVVPAQMTFVDDKVNHLDDVAALGVVCALAGWGYNGPREAALARQRGHAVLTLAKVERQLFGG